jgi:hypothetical protein
MFGLSAGAIALGVGGLALGASMGSSSPDTSGMNQAAKDNAALGREQLDWYKQIYQEQAPTREAATQRALDISDAQLDAMKNATWNARDTQAYNQRVFRPLEEGIVNDAENYDTSAKQEQAAGKAGADVSLAAAGARASGARDLERAGLNPADGAYADMEHTADVGLALGQVDAMNKAREQVKTVGRAMRADAANMGRGLPSQQATQAGLAITAGNSSVGNAGVPLALSTQGANMVGTGYNGAINANNSAGNIYGQVAQIQNTAGQQNNGLYSAIGQGAGAYFGAMSDRKRKKDIKKSSPELSLAAIRKTPVSKWKYKPGSGDGGAHTGPMAQDVEENFGSDTAPDGKVIDLVSMNGHSMNAIKALDKRVIALEHAKKR